MKTMKVRLQREVFPSPCGVMVAKARLLEEKGETVFEVSVPLRGNGCER